MQPDMILLYVEDPAVSARFYESLFGTPPIESSSTFVMFMARPGMMLGLWQKDGITPSANAAGGFELGLPVASDADVDRVAGEWADRHVTILQSPEDMDFGRTFTAADPDGHRIRVYSSAGRQ